MSSLSVLEVRSQKPVFLGSRLLQGCDPSGGPPGRIHVPRGALSPLASWSCITWTFSGPPASHHLLSLTLTLLPPSDKEPCDGTPCPHPGYSPHPKIFNLIPSAKSGKHARGLGIRVWIPLGEPCRQLLWSDPAWHGQPGTKADPCLPCWNSQSGVHGHRDQVVTMMKKKL